MNKERRKRLEKLVEQFEDLQSELQNIAEEERMCYDNMSESGLGESERCMQIEENADDLEQLDSDIENFLDDIREIIER